MKEKKQVKRNTNKYMKINANSSESSDVNRIIIETKNMTKAEEIDKIKIQEPRAKEEN